MNLVGCFFFFWIIERMAIWRKIKSNGINSNIRYKSYLF